MREGAKGLNDARDAIAAWYDDSMDRLSGEYKRYSQVMIGLVACLLVAVFNIDTVRIVRSLWADPQMRASLVEVALREAGAPSSGKPETLVGKNGDGKQAGPVVSGPQAVPGAAREPLPSALPSAALKDWAKAARTINEQSLPVGWTSAEFVSLEGTALLMLWLVKVLGFVFTALALSLGAPFWFDTLGKLANLRSAGPSPDARA
jgi:hypothetical protein